MVGGLTPKTDGHAPHSYFLGTKIMVPDTGSRFANCIDKLEENLIAFFMGMMTLITFANVIARYVFNANILWGLEVTVFIFAWLVLLGASYCVKKSLHLGVDVVVQLLSPKLRRICGLIAVTACVAFSVLLLIGSWEYWYPFVSKLAFYETDDVPVPFFLSFLGDVFNDGEAYEKLPKFIPYFVLPLSMALLLYRFLQTAVRIWRGDIYLVIANHEAEVDEALQTLGAADPAPAKPRKKTPKNTIRKTKNAARKKPSQKKGGAK